MVAEDGIGPFSTQLQAQFACFFGLIKYNPPLLDLTLFNSFGVRFGVRCICRHRGKSSFSGTEPNPKFIGLLGEFPGVRLLEPRKVLELPANRGQFGQVSASHQMPIRFTGHQAQ